MQNFSTEELDTLKRYPKEALDHANKQMKGMYLAHKPISNPFKWFVTVCENWIKKQKEIPKKGETKPIDPNRGSTDLSARKVRIQAAAQSKEWYNPKMSLEQMRVRLNDEVYEQQRRDRQEKMGLIDPVKELIEPELASTPFAAQLAQVFTQKTVSHNKRAPMFTDAPYLSEDSVWEEV